MGKNNKNITKKASLILAFLFYVEISFSIFGVE